MTEMNFDNDPFEPHLAVSAFPAEDFADLPGDRDGNDYLTMFDVASSSVPDNHPASITPRLAADFDSFVS